MQNRAAKKSRKPTITDLELTSLLTEAEFISDLKEQIAKRERAYLETEAAIMKKLKGGAVFEGEMRAKIEREIRKGRRSPKWKQLHLDHFRDDHGYTDEMVKKTEEAIIENTEPSPDRVVEKLVVL